MDLGLTGATVVVQGGTQGMGRAAAECFAAEGARVAVLARTKADLDTTVARLLELGAAEAFGLQADITVIEQVEAAFAREYPGNGVHSTSLSTPPDRWGWATSTNCPTGIGTRRSRSAPWA